MDFILRPWSLTDVDSLATYANNANIAKYLMNIFPHPYTIADAKKFIEMVSQHQPTQVFTIEVNGRASGAIGLFPQSDIMSKNAEMGYWLAEPLWGRGIITKAIKQMLEYGFKTWDINRIYARPFGTNTGSQKALEKAGFTLEGRFEKTIFKNGEFEDELVYAIRK
jgi:[ribosomal protein S5]-alanine N-acetyltransferase